MVLYINSKLDEKKWDAENFLFVYQYLKERDEQKLLPSSISYTSKKSTTL